MDVATFTIIAVAGLALLLAILMFDGVFDVFGGEPVLPSLAFFTTMFGGTGALATSFSDGSAAVYVGIAVAVGFVTTAVFWIAYRALRKHDDGDFTPDKNTLVGTVGTVEWWKDGTGGVIISFLGQPTSFRARNQTTNFGNGDAVRVLEVQGDTLIVAATV